MHRSLLVQLFLADNPSRNECYDEWLPGKILSTFILSKLFQGLESSIEIHFPASGNCYLRKRGLEHAVRKLTGIEYLNWDAGTGITLLICDESLADAFRVVKAIAHVCSLTLRPGKTIDLK